LTKPNNVVLSNQILLWETGLTADTTQESNAVYAYGSTIPAILQPKVGDFESVLKTTKYGISKRYSSYQEPVYFEDGLVKLRYNDGDFDLDETGLRVAIDASKIKVEGPYDMGDNSGLPPWYKPGGNLNDALSDIFHGKADLINGKVALQQLPDSIAYGGLLYIGTWQFDKSGGMYPQWADVPPELSEDKEVNDFQLGWFYVVDRTYDDELRPVDVQTAIDGVEFTAGDWLIYSGKRLVDPSDVVIGNYSDGTYKLTFGDKLEVFDDTGLLGTYSYEIDADTIRLLDDTDTEVGSGQFTKTTAGCQIVLSSYPPEIPPLLRLTAETATLKDVWTKLDKAYQDPVFSPLPAVTSDGRHWNMNESATPGIDYGEGALSLGTDTIYQAFTEVNEELLKLRRRYPKTFAEIEPRLVGGETSRIRRVSDVSSNKVTAPVLEIYDTRNLANQGISVEFDPVFYGHDADIEAVVDGREMPLTYNGTPKKAVDGTVEYTFAESIDPYAKQTGEGYWLAGSSKVTNTSMWTLGTHSISAMLLAVRPAHTPWLNAISLSKPVTFEMYERYRLEDAEYDSTSVMVYNFHSVFSDSDSGLMQWCSGVPAVKKAGLVSFFDSTARFRVFKYANGSFLMEENDFVVMTFANSMESHDDEPEVVSFLPNVEEPTYHDLVSTRVEFPVFNDIPLLEGDPRETDQGYMLSYKVNGVDRSSLEGKLFTDKLFVRVDRVTEPERVCSGILAAGKALDPDLEPLRADRFGAQYNSKEALIQGVYRYELMKRTLKHDDKYIEAYTWPDGVFNEWKMDETLFDGKHVDYLNTTSGYTVEGDTWRFVTFALFDEQPVNLFESSGFFVDIEAVDHNFTLDMLSGKTNGLKVHVYVDNWYDANAVFDGLNAPNTSLAPCMYAGSSDLLTKRVTFGSLVKSGRVYVRVGIPITSQAKIVSFKVRDIV
jgi:hypothetical protein